MLNVHLKREIPEALKPKTIKIVTSDATQKATDGLSDK
jgi:hypothetical protein